MTTTDQTRAAYISGLRRLADLLEQHNGLTLPWNGTSETASLQFISGDPGDQKAWMAAIARIIPGPWEKKITEHQFLLNGRLDGLHLTAIAWRKDVCERVVTGVETVTRTVPDPDALAAVPTVEVTETVEHVRWECPPLLASGA